MIRIKFKGYVVRVYTDPGSFARMPERPFGPVPRGTEFPSFEPDNMTGFVMLGDDPYIRLLVHPESTFENCLALVAHELGHKIEGGFKKNPAARMTELHEKKARHYEQFALDAYTLTKKIMQKVKQW